jgi:hypothetical protein
LPTLMSAILRLAQLRHASELEWFVFAANCARPNLRLRPILERRGFTLRETPNGGSCYYRRVAL